MAESVFEGPGEGAKLGHPLGGQASFKLRPDRSGGSLIAFETVVAPGQGPPLHLHANEDETLYVLDGQVRFKLGEEFHAGGVGSFVFVPTGAPHTFQNIGDRPARMLIHFSPSGMERFFERFDAVEHPDAGTFARIGAEVGMEVVGPPLAEADPV